MSTDAQAALLQRMNSAVQNAHKAMGILKSENDKLMAQNRDLQSEVSSLKKQVAELQRQAKNSTAAKACLLRKSTNRKETSTIESIRMLEKQRESLLGYSDTLQVDAATVVPTEDSEELQEEIVDISVTETILDSVHHALQFSDPQSADIPTSEPNREFSNLDSEEVIKSILGKRLGMKSVRGVQKLRKIVSTNRRLRILLSQLSSDNFHLVIEELEKQSFQSEEVALGFVHVVSRFAHSNILHLTSFTAFEASISHSKYYIHVLLSFLQELYIAVGSKLLSFLTCILERMKNVILGRLLLHAGQEPVQHVLIGRPTLHNAKWVHHVIDLKIKAIHLPNRSGKESEKDEDHNGIDHEPSRDSDLDDYVDLSSSSNDSVESNEELKQHNSSTTSLIAPRVAQQIVSGSTVNPSLKLIDKHVSAAVPAWLVETEQLESSDDENASSCIKPNMCSDAGIQSLDPLNPANAIAGTVPIISDTVAHSVLHGIDDLSTTTIAERLLKHEIQESFLFYLLLETCFSLEMFDYLYETLRSWSMLVSPLYPTDLYCFILFYRQNEEVLVSNRVPIKLVHLCRAIISHLKSQINEILVQEYMRNDSLTLAITSPSNSPTLSVRLDILMLMRSQLQSCEAVLLHLPDTQPPNVLENRNAVTSMKFLRKGMWPGLVELLSDFESNESRDKQQLTSTLGFGSTNALQHACQMLQALGQHDPFTGMISGFAAVCGNLQPFTNVFDLLLVPICAFEEYVHSHSHLQMCKYFDIPAVHEEYIQHCFNLFCKNTLPELTEVSITTLTNSIKQVADVVLCPFTHLVYDIQQQFCRVSGTTGFPTNYNVLVHNLLTNLDKKISSFCKYLRQHDASGRGVIPMNDVPDLLGNSHFSLWLSAIATTGPATLPFYTSGQSLGVTVLSSMSSLKQLSQLLAYCDRILFYPLHVDVDRLDSVGQDFIKKIRTLYLQLIDFVGMLLWERIVQGFVLQLRGLLQATSQYLSEANDEACRTVHCCQLILLVSNILSHDIPHPWGGSHISYCSYEVSSALDTSLQILNTVLSTSNTQALRQQCMELRTSLRLEQQALFPCFVVWPFVESASLQGSTAVSREEMLHRFWSRAVSNKLLLHMVHSASLKIASSLTEPSTAGYESGPTIDAYFCIPTTWDNKLRAKFTHRMPVAKKPLTAEELAETWAHWCIWHHITKLSDPYHTLPDAIESHSRFAVTEFVWDPIWYSSAITTNFQRSYLSSSSSQASRLQKFYVVLGSTAYIKQGVDFVESIMQVIRHLPADWDLLFLGGYCPRNNSLFQEHFTKNYGQKGGSFSKVNYIMDGVGYVIRDTAARKLVDPNAPLLAPVYDHLATMMYYEELQAFVMNDPLIVTDIKQYVHKTADPILNKKARKK